MNCAVHTQTQAVAYCRTCGKALCEACKRDVMGAIFCEPCIAARLSGQPAAQVNVVAPPPRVPGTPSPGLAAFLGLIPGVGAMYNGQLAKAFAHVVIFVLLIIATSKIAPIIGIFIGFFVVYMAYEAYKTAEAKRHGLPTPDPLGLDKMLGLQESAPSPAAQAYSAAPPLQVEAVPLPPPRDNAPIGAIVLIILGVLFLFSNFGMFDVDRLWPLFLIGIGLWTAYRRPRRQVCPCVRCRTRGMMGPAVLITLGVLFLLQSYGIVYFDRSFPVLLLVIGCVLLISRTGSMEGHIERGWIPSGMVPPGAVPPPPPGSPQPWTPGADNPPSSSGSDDTQVRP
jgi:TM2 domain-containing membrane protein YozV